MSMLPTNAIVARITGMNKALLTDKSGSGNELSEDNPVPGGMHAPSPLDTIHESKPRQSQPHELRQKACEASIKHRGDNADYQYDLPDADDSQEQEAPKPKMAKKKVSADMYGVDKQDSEPKTIGRTESNTSMRKFMKEYIVNLDHYRHFSGLPLTEGETGDVPTAGVNKDNKVKAGLSGLQGASLQAVEPADDGNKDNVGDAEELTLDQALAMLKKEGVDTNALWAAFLENRGLTVELFNQLVYEATEGEDAEEMDQLIAVENIFFQNIPGMLPDLLPEGLASFATLMNSQNGVVAQRVEGVRGGRRNSLTESKAAKLRKTESYEVECDHDSMSGGPMLPWMKKKMKKKMSKMESFSTKYAEPLAEGKPWMVKASKKGAVSKDKAAPFVKKGKGVKLAQTLAKLRK